MTTPLADRRLIICEHAYRGSAETQFADVLYIIRELSRQLGKPGLDLMLRGLAATWALDADAVPSAMLGERCLDTLPDPRASVRLLLSEGVAVGVAECDVRALKANPGWLISGIECWREANLALRWKNYESVWFM